MVLHVRPPSVDACKSKERMARSSEADQASWTTAPGANESPARGAEIATAGGASPIRGSGRMAKTDPKKYSGWARPPPVKRETTTRARSVETKGAFKSRAKQWRFVVTPP